MNDVVKFLRNRLAEDEAQARMASVCNDLEWSLPSSCVIDTGSSLITTDDRELAEHMGRHDPARVLRDVASKREIVDLCENMEWQSDHGRDTVAKYTLLHLASVWNTHPDYGEEWGP